MLQNFSAHEKFETFEGFVSFVQIGEGFLSSKVV